MNRTAAILLAASLGLAGSGLAGAHGVRFDGLSAATHYPGAPRLVSDDRNASPYPMNYTDEAAQTLGVRHGHIELFSNGGSGDGIAPAVSGGVDRSGAMIKLQWHPGE